MRLLSSVRGTSIFSVLAATLIGIPLLVLLVVLEDDFWVVAVPAGGGFMALAVLAYRNYTYVYGHWRNRILYLRAFSDADANLQYYRLLGPLLSCFGRSDMAMAPEPYAFRLSGFHTIMNLSAGRPNNIGARVLDGPQWRGEITELLENSRLVIVDLSTLTDNVRWELATAVELLGRDRVIAVVRGPRSSRLLADEMGIASLSISAPGFLRQAGKLCQSRLGPATGISKKKLDALQTSGDGWRFTFWLVLELWVRLFFRRPCGCLRCTQGRNPSC